MSKPTVCQGGLNHQTGPHQIHYAQGRVIYLKPVEKLCGMKGVLSESVKIFSWRAHTIRLTHL